MGADTGCHDLALDIGATKWLLGDGRVRPFAPLAQGTTTDDPFDTLDGLMTEVQRRGLHPRTLGIAFPGTLDRAGAVEDWPMRRSWLGTPLIDELSRYLPHVTAMEVRDDGFAAALGEAVFGVARSVPDNLTVTVGTGIGAALVLDGQPRRPRSARTIGHWPVLDRRAPCACGSYGCLQLSLETLAPADPLEDRLDWVEGETCLRTVKNLMDQAGVDTLVLTGGLANRTDLQAFVRRWCVPLGMTVLIPRHPSWSALLGALVRAGGRDK